MGVQMSNAARKMIEEPLPDPRPVVVDIGALFDEHGAFLVRVAHRLTGSRATAEDIVQEVFVTAWRRRTTLQADSHLRTWLYRVTVNHVRHHQRSHVRLSSFLSRYRWQWPGTSPEAPDEPLQRAAEVARVHDCVQRLSPKLREVFVLYELEELEGIEIAEILETPINTVWSRLRLARDRFRKEWEAIEGATP